MGGLSVAPRGSAARGCLDWYHNASVDSPNETCVWFVFPTDAGLEHATASGLTARIDALIRQELLRRDFPHDAVRDVFVGFKTHEALKRQPGEGYMDALDVRSVSRPDHPVKSDDPVGPPS